MMPDDRRIRIPDVELEQYLLGELSKRGMDETERTLEQDGASRARLEALERSNREILERYPAELMGRQIRSRLENPGRPRSATRPRRLWPVTAVLGGAAALLVLAVLPSTSPTPSATQGGSSRPPTERVKGGPRIELHRQTPDGSEILADGARAFPGDLIRIGYQAVGRPYGVIVSVDGRGETTVHLPQRGTCAAPLEAHGQVLLAFALELDDAPRWERFYFLTGEAPFEVAPVLQATEQVDLERSVDRPEPLEVPGVDDQFVVSLEKGTVR